MTNMITGTDLMIQNLDLEIRMGLDHGRGRLDVDRTSSSIVNRGTHGSERSGRSFYGRRMAATMIEAYGCKLQDFDLNSEFPDHLIFTR